MQPGGRIKWKSECFSDNQKSTIGGDEEKDLGRKKEPDSPSAKR